MIIINNAITDDQINLIRSYVSEHDDRKYVNWVENNKVIDNRWNLPLNNPNFSFIQKLVEQHFNNWTDMWSAYQIQTNPHNIHIDEYGKESWPSTKCWTYIFAFDTVPEFKTVIWKEQFRDGESFSKWVKHFWTTDDQKCAFKKSISQTQDLEHTYDINNQDYLADYLTLEGVFTYKKGSAVLFDGNKLHCTSNWKKYPKFFQRELLQIHVLSKSPKFDF
jgi:hypothetical protein